MMHNVVKASLSGAAFLVTFAAMAAWWKDWAFVNSGNTDHDLALYSNWEGVTENTDWTQETLYFQYEYPLYQNGSYSWGLSKDMTVSYIESANSGINLQMAFGDHALTTCHESHGFYLSASNAVALASGTLRLGGKLTIGNNGAGTSFQVAGQSSLLELGNMGVGCSYGVISCDNILDVAGGHVTFREGAWGFAIGEGGLTYRNRVVVQGGGVLEHHSGSAIVGLRSNDNSMEVRHGGVVNVDCTLLLGQSDNAGASATGNRIVAEMAGTFNLNSQGNSIWIGADTRETDAPGNNMILAGEYGMINCAGNIIMWGGGNSVVASNGTINCSSFSSVYNDRHTSHGTRLSFFGSTPQLQVREYFQARNSSTLHFDVPKTGYLTIPLSVGYKCTFDADTTLEVSVEKGLSREFGNHRASFEIVRSGGDGIVAGDDTADTGRAHMRALVAQWNRSLPKKVQVRLDASGGSLYLDVLPPGFCVIVR